MAAAAEAWRLAASLASHWSALHFATNAAAISLLARVVARRDGLGALGMVLLAGFAVQLAALAWVSDATEYRGSSGFAWALAAFILARRLGPAAASLLLLAGWACMPSTSPVLPPGVTADPAMHAAGALAGLLAAQLSRARPSIRSLLRLTNSAGSSSCPPSASKA